MEINVCLMTEEAYKTLQKNYKDVYQMILNNPNDSSWLNEFLGFDPYIETKYVINDFTLYNDTNYDDVAFDNALILYEMFKELPRYILCNNRFWAWVLFTKFYKQAPKAVEFTENTIKTRWLVGTSRRNLMLGVVSRNFFKVEVSIDDTKQENSKYDLVRFLFANHTPYKNIVMRNIGMLKNVVIPYLKICKDAQENHNISLTDDFCSNLMKEASKIGSVMLIDVIKEEEIYKILYKKVEKYYKENKK